MRTVYILPLLAVIAACNSPSQAQIDFAKLNHALDVCRDHGYDQRVSNNRGDYSCTGQDGSPVKRVSDLEKADREKASRDKA